MSKPATDPRIVFLDLETTGLDPSRDAILEIGIRIISRRLRDVPGGDFSRLVKVNVGALSIDQDVREMHTKNGLYAALDAADNAPSVSDVEQRLIGIIEAHGLVGENRVPLAGSTISFDRAFLKAWMPTFEGMLHYRNVDVSTVRELARRWRKDLPDPPKAEAHRALADVRESIEYLRHYRRHGFIG